MALRKFMSGAYDDFLNIAVHPTSLRKSEIILYEESQNPGREITKNVLRVNTIILGVSLSVTALYNVIGGTDVNKYMISTLEFGLPIVASNTLSGIYEYFRYRRNKSLEESMEEKR